MGLGFRGLGYRIWCMGLCRVTSGYVGDICEQWKNQSNPVTYGLVFRIRGLVLSL